jgi:hypothetical protein
MKANQEKVAHTAEMIEGPEAFERLRNAMKTILSVPKSALPPSPYKQRKPTTEKASHP